MHKEGNRITTTQPLLAKSTLKDLSISDKEIRNVVPAHPTNILKVHNKSAPFAKLFDYVSVIGKLVYLEKSYPPRLGIFFSPV